MLRGWLPAYPETSGYIIGTFIRRGGAELAERARQLGDWEVEIQEVDRCGSHRGAAVRQLDAGRARAALGGVPRPGMIDEHGAHHVGGDGEEVRPVLPRLAWMLLREAHVGLVHQRRRLQRVVRTLAAQMPRRDAAQLRVDQLHEAGEGGGVSAGPVPQQPRDLVASRIRHRPA